MHDCTQRNEGTSRGHLLFSGAERERACVVTVGCRMAERSAVAGCATDRPVLRCAVCASSNGPASAAPLRVYKIT